MIRLNSMNLKGFRSFAEESSFEFPETGMVLIRGRKEDGGSSGAGKSSILLAISYALGFCPYPATELQSDLTDAEMRVYLRFSDSHDRSWFVARSPGSLRVGSQDTFAEHKGKVAERVLGEILGTSPEMIEALTYREQKKPGRFLSKPDSEKKEFLSALLGLERFEEAAEAAGKEANELGQVDGLLKQIEEYRQYAKAESEKEHKLSGELFSLKHDLSQAEIALGAAQVKHRRDDARLFVAKATFAEALEAVPANQELTKLRGLQDQMARKITDLINDDKKRQRQAETNFYHLQQELAKAERELDKVDSLQKDIKRLEKQCLPSSGICPTCKRDGWTQGYDHAVGLQTEIKGLERQIVETAKKWVPVRDDYTQQLEKGLQFRPDPNIEKLTVATRELVQRIKAVEEDTNLQKQKATAQAAGEQAQIQAEVDVAHRAFNEARLAFRLLTEQVRLKEQELQQAMDSILRWMSKAEAAGAEYESAKRKVALLRDFQSLVGREGFLGAIFDEILAEITDETNRILARVPNTDTVTIRFDSEATTKAGKVNRNIVPVLSVAGNTGKLESRCSGGMMSSIELAVDLAVAEVISRRTNSSPGWMCLDESFDGLDSASKEACFQLLHVQAQKKLILIVDHSESFSELFAATITVTSKGGKSVVESGMLSE